MDLGKDQALCFKGFLCSVAAPQIVVIVDEGERCMGMRQKGRIGATFWSAEGGRLSVH